MPVLRANLKPRTSKPAPAAASKRLPSAPADRGTATRKPRFAAQPRRGAQKPVEKKARLAPVVDEDDVLCARLGIDKFEGKDKELFGLLKDFSRVSVAVAGCGCERDADLLT